MYNENRTNFSPPTRRANITKNKTSVSNNTKKIVKESIISSIVQFVTESLLKVLLRILGILTSILLVLFTNHIPTIDSTIDSPIKTPTDTKIETPRMPNLIGMSYDSAVTHFYNYNQNIKNIKNITFKQKVTYSTSFEKNKVIKQSIAVDTLLNTDDMHKITLTVGKGEPIVPNCINKKLKNAKKDLEKLCLKCKIKKVYSNSVKKGHIIKQSICEKHVAPKTTIELTVSRGKFPSTSAPPRTNPPHPVRKTSPPKPPPTLKPVKLPEPTLEPMKIDE